MRGGGLRVIDLTASAYLVHQKHDYSHLGNGLRDYNDARDANHNRRLLGNPFRVFTIEDATHSLGPGTFLNKQPRLPLARRVRQIMSMHPALIWIMRVIAFPILAMDTINTLRRQKGGRIASDVKE